MSRDWAKTMLRASYKGIQFYVDKDVIVGGRRISIHEFTNRDNPFNEDLGGKHQIISVDGYVEGDAADQKGSALFAACNAKGVGSLVLPLLGTNSVQCLDVKLQNDYRKLGVIKVTMSFVKDSGISGGLIASINPLRNVQVLASQARQVVSDAFSARYSTQIIRFGQVTDLAMSAVADEIQLVAGLGLVALESVGAAQATFAQANRAAIVLAENAQNYSRQIIRNGDEKSIYSNAGLATNNFMGLMNASVTDSRALFMAISETIDVIDSPSFLDDDISHLSVTRQSTARLLGDYRTAARQALAITAIEAAGAAAQFISSRSDARFLRARMGDITDAVMAEAQTQEELAALTDVRGAAAQALKDAGILNVDAFQNNLGRNENNVGNSAELVISASKQLPSTYWGWRLYSDPSRASELVARNKVPHPSFMPYDFEALGQ